MTRSDVPLRIGVVGLGFGLDVHVPAFQALNDVEVVALLGRDSQRAQTAQRRTGISTFTNVESFFDAGLDAVSVAVPPNAVDDIVSIAIQRKLPVLCEKPLGSDAEVARRLADVAATRANAIGFEFADLETFKALRETIEHGEIGTVRMASVTWLSESWAYRGGGWSWKTDDAQSGGAISLFGTHLFHLAEWLLGSATRLTARCDSGASTRLQRTPQMQPAADLVTVNLEHDAGCISTLAFGNAAPGFTSHRWVLVGERGVAVLDNPTQAPGSGFVLRVIGPEGRVIRQLDEPVCEGDSRIPPFSRLAERFVRAVRTDSHCRPDFADAVRVAILTGAVQRATTISEWIDVPV